jgi:hypothetical protein
MPVKIRDPKVPFKIGNGEFTYWKQRILRYAEVKNALSPSPLNSYSTELFYYRGRTVVKYSTPKNLSGVKPKTGRLKPESTYEGQVVITDDEIVMGLVEFVEHCKQLYLEKAQENDNEESEAFKTFLALKEEFNKSNSLVESE